MCTLARTVKLNDNRLAGPVPGATATWRSLSIFYLGANQLSGLIPGAVGSSWSQVDEAIDIGDNRLTGLCGSPPRPADQGKSPRASLNFPSLQIAK